MDFSAFIKALELLKLQDTLLAMVVLGLACFYIGTRLQKKIGEFATKKELMDHRKAVYLENLQVKDAVNENLSDFGRTLKEHQEEDKATFAARDQAETQQVNNIYRQLNGARRSLSRIEGKLNIPKEAEDEQSA